VLEMLGLGGLTRWVDAWGKLLHQFILARAALSTVVMIHIKYRDVLMIDYDQRQSHHLHSKYLCVSMKLACQSLLCAVYIYTMYP
jgi:hypothetical protein